MKAFKRMLAALLAAVLLAALAGCGGSAAPEEPENQSPADEAPAVTEAPAEIPAEPEKTLCLAYFPGESMNPFSCGNIYNESLAKLIYEGLFSLEGDYSAESCLCKDYYTDDNVTWWFNLKEGVYFHNGQPLTAADAAYSIRYSGLINGSVSAETDSQLLIVLNRADENLPQLLDIAVVPYGTAEEDMPSGTGPYRLSGYGRQASLSYFKAWHGAAPMPERIELFSASGIAEVMDAFGAGDVSVVLTGYGAYQVGFTVDCDIWDCPTTIMHFVGFNCHNGHCSDYRLRYALQYAMDREEIASECLGGQAREAVLPLNPSAWDYDWELHGQYAYSPEKFAQAMEDMYGGDVNANGYWDLSGWDVELDFIVNSESSEKVDAAEQIAARLGELGIKVHLQALDWEDFITALAYKNYDMYYGQVRLSNDFSLYELLEGSMNYGDFSMVYDWEEFYPYFFSRAPFVSLCYENHSVLTRRGELTGLDPVQGNIYNDIENWKFS